MPFVYDFTKIKDKSAGPQKREPIPPGWYPFRIEEATETMSKSGNPMVKTVCVCLDPRHPGSKVWHYVTFLPEGQKGSFMAKHFVKSLGFDVETMRSVDPYEWQGKTFMGKVTVEEYNGNRNNKFAAISPITEGTGATEEDAPF